MPARLAASIVAFCIALPMCWCCVGTPEVAAKKVHSCCSSQSAETEPQPPGQGGEHQCPCAAHGDSRDMADTLVAAPVPALKLLQDATWHVADTVLAPFPAFHAQSEATHHDYGPPGGCYTPPLYAQHCALLI